MSDRELWAKAEDHAVALVDLLKTDNRGKPQHDMPYWFVLGAVVGALTAVTKELSMRGVRQA